MLRTRTRQFSLALTVALLVAAGAVAGPPAGAGPMSRARPGAVDWRPCPEDGTAECGTVRVPVDWAHPYGPGFDLALARRRATGPAARIGSLVVNPGGPGGSGVDFALFGHGFLTPQLRGRFDIVGFDPRGVRRSHPVRCSAGLLAAAPSPLMTSQADFAATVAYNRRLAEDCRRHTGALFDHVDTLSVVRDMEAIRAALGDPKLSFYGVSYGTLMGHQYAERFPHRVRALALDSNMDHSLGVREFLDTETATAQDSFVEFARWCRRDTRCVLRGRDVAALWRDLLARAGRRELRDPFQPDQVVTPLHLIDVAFGSFYGPEWFALAYYLQALDAGEVPESAAGSAAARRAARHLPARTGPRTGTDRSPAEPALAESPFQAVFCEDWSLPVRDYQEYAAHLRRMAGIAPDMRFSPLALTAAVSCLGWRSPVNNPQHRLRVRIDGKLLLVNPVHDPATGYAWAANAARQLGRHAALVSYEGWGHAAYGRSACVTGSVDRYLLSLSVPSRGARCAAVPPEPFGVGGVSARSSPRGPGDRVPGW